MTTLKYEISDDTEQNLLSLLPAIDFNEFVNLRQFKQQDNLSWINLAI